ncbi:tRNA (guanine(6)-N(2))-methyltransferase THUMP3-like [Dermacentor variabilis]|uniref:tRNA (guanine(6)-N(2))-methyltransferase THUMP3-like n=1 Tax=Dermacentor variabilis TaxID=34621 RepID=UPI003F5BA5EB
MCQAEVNPEIRNRIGLKMAATSDSNLDSKVPDGMETEVCETSCDGASTAPAGEHAFDAVCRIEATVVTGLEHIARDECTDKLGVRPETARGRVFFDLPVDRVTEVWHLQGVDNLYVVIATFSSMEVPSSKEEMEAALVPLVEKMRWETGLEVWRRMHPNAKFELADFFHQRQKEPDSGAGDEKETDKKEGPKFRVTCHRSGENHKFTSMEAAAVFGGAVNDFFGWGVDMRNYDLEVVLHVDPGCVYVCLTLTQASLHHRHLEHFGPTSLRCTIAYNMLRLCDLKPSDIVCDPMVGGGSIPLEGCVNWPQTVFVCGDNHPLAVQRTYDNLSALNEKRAKASPEGSGQLCLDVCQWDACSLPFKTASVDVFITDLPFGKRMGSRPDNRMLYPRLLQELARAARPRTGRAVLLTQDKKSLSLAVGRLGRLWRQLRVHGVNVGGLAAAIYVLRRTDVAL